MFSRDSGGATTTTTLELRRRYLFISGGGIAGAGGSGTGITGFTFTTVVLPIQSRLIITQLLVMMGPSGPFFCLYNSSALPDELIQIQSQLIGIDQIACL